MWFKIEKSHWIYTDLVVLERCSKSMDLESSVIWESWNHHRSHSHIHQLVVCLFVVVVLRHYGEWWWWGRDDGGKTTTSEKYMVTIILGVKKVVCAWCLMGDKGIGWYILAGIVQSTDPIGSKNTTAIACQVKEYMMMMMNGRFEMKLVCIPECDEYIFEYSNIRIFSIQIFIRTFVRINFLDTNVFGYSFVSFSWYEYIRIFVRIKILLC